MPSIAPLPPSDQELSNPSSSEGQTPSITPSDKSPPPQVPIHLSSSIQSSEEPNLFEEIATEVKKFYLLVFSAVCEFVDMIIDKLSPEEKEDREFVDTLDGEVEIDKLLYPAESEGKTEEKPIGTSLVENTLEDQQLELLVGQEEKEGETAESADQTEEKPVATSVGGNTLKDQPPELLVSEEEKEDANFFDASDGETAESADQTEEKPVATPVGGNALEDRQPEMLVGKDEEDDLYASFSDEESEEESVESLASAPAPQVAQEEPAQTPVALFQALPPLSSEMKGKVAWFFKTMAEEAPVKLGMPSRQDEIKKKVAGIESDHPLRLLEYVLQDGQTLKHLKAIPARWLVGSQIWNGCTKMFGDAIVWRIGQDKSLFIKQFEGFAEEYQLDSKRLLPLLEQAADQNPPNWANFLKILFSIPI